MPENQLVPPVGATVALVALPAVAARVPSKKKAARTALGEAAGEGVSDGELLVEAVAGGETLGESVSAGVPPAAVALGVCVVTKVASGESAGRGPLVRTIHTSSTTAPAGVAVPLPSATCSSRT